MAVSCVGALKFHHPNCMVPFRWRNKKIKKLVFVNYIDKKLVNSGASCEKLVARRNQKVSFSYFFKCIFKILHLVYLLPIPK